jgi:hypothetical protein
MSAVRVVPADPHHAHDRRRPRRRLHHHWRRRLGHDDRLGRRLFNDDLVRRRPPLLHDNLIGMVVATGHRQSTHHNQT